MSGVLDTVTDALGIVVGICFDIIAIILTGILVASFFDRKDDPK